MGRFDLLNKEWQRIKPFCPNGGRKEGASLRPPPLHQCGIAQASRQVVRVRPAFPLLQRAHRWYSLYGVVSSRD